MRFVCLFFLIGQLSLLENAYAQNVDCNVNDIENITAYSERDKRMLDKLKKACIGDAKSSRKDNYSISGSGRFIVPQLAAQKRTERKHVEVVADDVSLVAFMDSVVFDVFETPYILPPDLDVTLSLRVDKKMRLDEFLTLLNNALLEQKISLTIIDGVVIVDGSKRGRQSGGGINKIGIAPSKSPIDNADAVLYDLKYVPAKTIVAVLEPLFGNNVFRSFVNERGLLSMKGDERSMRLATDIVEALDVPFLSNANFELVILKHSLSTTALRQIDQIFEQTAILSAIDIPDANAILLVAKSRESIDQAKKLISIIDAPSHTNSQNESWAYTAQYAEAEHLKSILDQHLGRDSRGLVVVDPNTGVLTVTGPIGLREKMFDVLRLIDLPRKQVSIEVTVVEITLIDEFQFGIQWEALLDEFTAGFTDNNNGVVARQFPGVSAAYVGSDFSAILSALDAKTHVEVVSSPHLMTYDRQMASISIGSEVPVVVQQAVSTQTDDAPLVTTTEYRQTGVDLEVTPTIRGNQIVEIALKQEISDVVESGARAGDAPTFSQSRIENAFMVPSGTIIAIGGLIELSESETETGVPGLKNIPGLGRAFRVEERTKERTELVLLVRPTITESFAVPQQYQDIGESMSYAHEAHRLKAIDKALDSGFVY